VFFLGILRKITKIKQNKNDIFLTLLAMKTGRNTKPSNCKRIKAWVMKKREFTVEIGLESVARKK
jgi:hypothetical protein